MNEQQSEFGFVSALPSARTSHLPGIADQAFSAFARRKGQKWLRVEAARALKKNARSQQRAGHDQSNAKS